MSDALPIVVLARLALVRDEQGKKLGGHLLVDALRRCVRGGAEFGARAVVVDAIDDRSTAFYRYFGFHDLEGSRLWRRLGDVAQATGT
jgi:predicted N-acetyltransferase YhbS